MNFACLPPGPFTERTASRRGESIWASLEGRQLKRSCARCRGVLAATAESVQEGGEAFVPCVGQGGRMLRRRTGGMPLLRAFRDRQRVRR
jgi:hypothetical protein